MLDSYGVIYKITNLLNHKCYIGQTVNVKKRINDYNKWRTHCKGIPKLYNAFCKYGIDGFKFELIERATNKEHLDLLEDKYIIQFNTINNGYNCKGGGANGKHSDETKLKMSENLKQQYKNGRIPPLTGKHHSNETRSKMSKIGKQRFKEGWVHPLKGKHLSNETKAKLSKSIKLRYSTDLIHPFKGKHHSKTTKLKMSKCAIGRRHTPATIEKLRKIAINRQQLKNEISMLGL